MQEILGEVLEQQPAINEDEIAGIIEYLRAFRDIEDMERNKISIISQYSTNGALFIERFIDMHKYIPFDKLTNVLQIYDKPRQFKDFKNATIFWALEENHSFKLGVRSMFPLNSRLTGDEVKENINRLLRGNFDYSGNDIGSQKCFSILKLFCKVSNRIRSRERGNIYEIQSFDVLELNCEPLTFINADKSIRRLLDLF